MIYQNNNLSHFAAHLGVTLSYQSKSTRTYCKVSLLWGQHFSLVGFRSCLVRLLSKGIISYFPFILVGLGPIVGPLTNSSVIPSAQLSSSRPWEDSLRTEEELISSNPSSIFSAVAHINKTFFFFFLGSATWDLTSFTSKVLQQQRQVAATAVRYP